MGALTAGAGAHALGVDGAPAAPDRGRPGVLLGVARPAAPGDLVDLRGPRTPSTVRLSSSRRARPPQPPRRPAMTSIRAYLRPVLVSSVLLSVAAGLAFGLTFLLRLMAFGAQ